MALDDHLARFLGTASATGNLHDQLRHALAGAKVGRKQAAVGVEDRHQGHPWKVMPLGEHLRADQDARLALVDGGEQAIHGALARGAVAVDAQHRVVGKQHRQALFGALGAGADGTQVEVLAFWTVARLPLDMATVVAAQFLIALVHGHACVAAWAFGQPAAVVAEQGRGEAAAVEKYQHLLAGGEGLGDGLLHRPGDARVQWPALHVQAQEARLAGAAGALCQLEQGIAAGVGVVQAFQRRCSRAEDDGHVFLARAHQRQVAGVVAQTLLLFIGGVVFFVDDDQPRVLHRREQSRAGADDDVGLAIACRQPGVEALAVVDRRMQQGDTCIEAAGETVEGLWAEVDLGDQHQRLLAGLQALVDQLQVHLGFAAAGDASQ